MQNAETFASLRTSTIFSELPTDFCESFLNGCAVHRYETAECFLEQGKPSNGLYLVSSGYATVQFISDAGETVLVHRPSVGETLGELEAICDGLCAANCVAAPGSVFLFCPKPLLLSYLSNVVFVRNLFKLAHQRLSRDNQFRVIDQTLSVSQRLAAYLLFLSDEQGVIVENQSYLASVVKCSRQTINKELGMLQERDVVKLGRGNIRLLDRGFLAQMLRDA